MQTNAVTLLTVKGELDCPFADFMKITDIKLEVNPIYIHECQSNITAGSINLSNRNYKLTLGKSCNRDKS